MNSAATSPAGADGLSRLGKAALAYARAGKRVFPVGVNKIPMLRGWTDNASSNPDIVVRWWTKNPDANISALTGTAGNCIVLDIDPRNGGEESLARLEEAHGPLPETLTCITGGGGRHLYFQLPEFEVRSQDVAPGVEVLGERKAAVFPPSMHASGQRYAWAPGTKAIASAPVWLLDLVRPKPIPPMEPVSFECREDVERYVRPVPDREVDAILSAPVGKRNHQLNRSAYNLGQLVGAGALDEGEMRDLLIRAGCRAGMPIAAVRATVRSGLEAGIQNPRRLDLDGGA